MIGQNNVTAFLQATFLGAAAPLIPSIKSAYPIGNDSLLTNDYDAVSQIFTEVAFQCVS